MEEKEEKGESNEKHENSNKEDKKDNKKDFDTFLEDLEKLEKTKEAYYPLLKLILNDRSINEKNYLEKLKEYVKNNSKHMTRIDNTLFELIMYVHPQSESIKDDLNRKYLINIMKYLISKKKPNKGKSIEKVEEYKNPNDSDIEEEPGNISNLNEINTHDGLSTTNDEQANEVLLMCSNIFNENDLFKILFDNYSEITNKIEYLEMILLFIPEKDTEKILDAINKNLKGENKEEINKTFKKFLGRVYLKSKIGFQFLRQAILLYLQNKDNFLRSFEVLEENYVIQNTSLRCTQCYSLPLFVKNSEGIITIRYVCDHNKTIENEKLKDIQGYKFKCSNCENFLFKSYKNKLCSNCKKIFCNSCIYKHFEKCASIFFISIYKIDYICCDHKLKYTEFCTICNLDLCKRCIQEHPHKVEKEKQISLGNEDLKKFNDSINQDIKSDKIIISAIKNIVQESNNNFNNQFFYLIRAVIQKDIKSKSELFSEFFCEDFQNYYAHMVKQIKNGDYYFLNALERINDCYEHAKINEKYNPFLSKYSFKYTKQQNEIIPENSSKYILLINYFNKINEIKVQKQILDNEINIRMKLIEIKEDKIFAKCILNSESLYKNELLKLIERSMAENILVYLINKHPDKLKTIDLNLNIYADLENYYKKDQEKFEKIKKSNIDEINSLFSENSNIASNIANKNYKIVFVKPIQLGNDTIEVNKLNQLLEFLYYIKEKGNFTAHPNNEVQVKINPNKHEVKHAKNKDDINTVKKNIQLLLKNEYTKKRFQTPAKPKMIFECLFNLKINQLFYIEKDEEMDDKIETIIENSLSEIKNEFNAENILKNYEDKIEQLEDIYGKLNGRQNESRILYDKNILKQFLKRLTNILDNEKKILNFLDTLNKNKYETSVTGEKNCFISFCCDHIIRSLLPEIKKKIDSYKKDKDLYIKKIQSKEEIIALLDKVYQKKYDNLDGIFEPIIDPKKISEYVNRKMNNSQKKDINLDEIRSIMEKLINEQLDWTAKKKCKLSTLLFLRQNKY